MKYYLTIIIAIVSISCIKKEKHSTEKTSKVLVKAIINNKEIEQNISIEEYEEFFRSKITFDTIFNKKGKPTKVIHNLWGKKVIEKFSYNANNQLKSRMGLNTDSVLTPIYNDVCIVQYHYKDDLLVSEYKFNIHEELISSKWEDTPIIEYKYNKQNKLTEIWYLNEKKQLRDEYAIQRFTSDSENFIWVNLNGETEKQ